MEPVIEQFRIIATRWGSNPDLVRQIRDFLIHGYPVVMATCLAALAAGLLLGSFSLRKPLASISRKTRGLLLILFLLAWFSRMVVAYHQPQVFFDEINLLDTAENLLRDGSNRLTVNPGDTRAGFVPVPAVWPILMAISFALAGAKDSVAFNLSALLGALSVGLAFLLVWLLFFHRPEPWREQAGLWAALFLAINPVAIRISGAAAMEPANVFFLLLALVCSLWYFRQPSFWGELMAFLSAGVACNVRQENVVLLVPLLVLWWMVFHPALKVEARRPGFYCGLLVFIYAVFPAALNAFIGVSSGFYFFYESSELIHHHVKENLLNNLLFWIENRINPIFVTLAAGAGIVGLFYLPDISGLARRERKIGWVLFTWFGCFQLFYSLNPSCDFSLRFTFDSWRTSINPLIPLILLAGAGMVMGGEWLTNWIKMHLAGFAHRFCTGWGTIIMIILLLTIPIAFLQFIRSDTVWTAQYRFQKHLVPLAKARDFIFIDGSSLYHERLPAQIRFASGSWPFIHEYDPQRPSSSWLLVNYIPLQWTGRKTFIYLVDDGSGRGRYARQWYCHYFRTRVWEGWYQDGYYFLIMELRGRKTETDRR